MTTTESPESAQTALDLWNEQAQQLVAPEHADAAINAIYQNLMGLHEKLKSNGNEKAAAKVEEAYNQALAIYNMTTQQSVVITGGAAAIQEAERQRKQAVIELAQLLKAINDGDESHPKLVSYASTIREEESMDSYEMAYQEIDENITEQIVDAWGVDWEKADMILMAVLGRPEPELTPQQRGLFQAFIDSLKSEDDEEWGGEE